MYNTGTGNVRIWIQQFLGSRIRIVLVKKSNICTQDFLKKSESILNYFFFAPENKGEKLAKGFLLIRCLIVCAADLPRDVLSTPMGQMLAPMIQQMTPSGTAIPFMGEPVAASEHFSSKLNKSLRQFHSYR